VSRLLYADTGAFIALVYGRDRAHLTISAHLRSLAAAGDRLITSEPVISETVTRLRYDAGLRRVAAFRDVVQRAVGQNFLSIRESSSGLRRSAFGILEQYEDLRLSYADAVGAVVAREGRADAVFGLDNDFRVMGFVLEP
jgi:predicted nucleic acid-binding protein